jgi:VWFA-related protein
VNSPARALVALVVIVALTASGSAQDQPRFRTGVEVASVDATVVDDRGRVVADLKASDFSVSIDGAARKVLSAEWIRLAAPVGSTPAAAARSYSTNENSTGRLIVVVVDEVNIPFGGSMYLRDSVNAFIDALHPADRVAVVGIGTGAPSLPFTTDRARVKQTLGSMRGGRKATETDQTIRELRGVINGLREIDAPKTILLVSEGFIAAEVGADDPAGVDPAADPTPVIRGVPNAPIDTNNTSRLMEVGNLAAQTRTTIYGLYLDRRVSDITQREPAEPGANAHSRAARRESLATLTNAAGGALLNVGASPAAAFERVGSELEGYYLLGVESVPADSDGRLHSVRVEVLRSGVTVRSRQFLKSPVSAAEPRPTTEAIGAALASPLMRRAIPLRVATFALRGNDPSKVQVLIAAEVGGAYTAPIDGTIAFVVTDGRGRVVEAQSAKSRLQLVRSGGPSPVQYAGAVALPPGEYVLKLAVSDEERIGTVEHPLDARLTTARRITFSQLVVGGVSGAGAQLRPVAGPIHEDVQGYLEAYGAGVENLSVVFEIAQTDKGAALATLPAPVSARAASRAAFRAGVPIRTLAPGEYVMRAVVKSGDDTVVTMVRGMEIGGK